MTPNSRPASGPSLVRLNKFLSTAGVASRRKADTLILEGRVSVNSIVVDGLGAKVDPVKDRVFVDGKQISTLTHKSLYIVLNKPKDAITTASDERGRTTVMDYVKLNDRVFPIGRLDRNTTGVLLLTNDGEFANHMMHPRHEVSKAYRVTVDHPIGRPEMEKLAKGIRLSEGMTGEAEVVPIPGKKNKELGIVIREGKNRQIHRMFEALGFEVVKLDRVAYAGITYQGLPRGKWRFLTRTEVRSLRRVIGMTDPIDEV
jgi:pseudouridine synthase